VENRDDLFLWVRGLSMALEKTGKCASSFTVADIHAAIKGHNGATPGGSQTPSKTPSAPQMHVLSLSPQGSPASFN